ncbi:preprotein translocase subunit SecG [Candidatus Woesebacteria bacterium RBG_19FT_COMBO_47_8]|uniref:Protein-export membrane protein SecG n=1 Tax=Candidatus Woesebacteria bacterium RBG_13_46_13 TaxID=1802479 RepID=A0A1F7X3W5_9BACT|nr:MAG: preprotein translocase subunit SecG [Candidatus Woesebacteria bacterium RBG_13_46_13]OGM16622.1 MAG: preprotein translocase subunit SecG [Candidatus Woesebacteria bacterium RBG_19FT_COMBO_47_8]HJX59620.1 preprotein translocase subunit SecG [Patescibacteria group bacterium]
MKQVLTVIQIVVSLLMLAVILVQSKGTGFGRSWGQAASFSRRGLEKLIFRSTFVLAALFIILSLLQLFY